MKSSAQGAAVRDRRRGACIAPAPVLAQSKPSTDSREASGAPTEAALAVGALQIGSVANLEVAGFDIAVTAGSIVYSYYFTNKGNADLAVAASASLPELHASADRSETWTLARNDPENFVDLRITAGGGPVATKAAVRANALGVDRLAEIQAEHLPLLPFGAATDKALRRAVAGDCRSARGAGHRFAARSDAAEGAAHAKRQVWTISSDQSPAGKAKRVSTGRQ